MSTVFSNAYTISYREGGDTMYEGGQFGAMVILVRKGDTGMITEASSNHGLSDYPKSRAAWLHSHFFLCT